MTAHTAFDRIVTALQAQQQVTPAGSGRVRARCPGHDGQSDNSLSVTRIDGSVLLHCFAGCDVDAVVAGLDLTRRDLYDNPRGAEYRYTDPHGAWTRTVHRGPDKKFRQTGDTKGNRTLYRLPQVIAAVAAGRTVYVVEGEKDVHAMETLGVVATTNPEGAGKWRHVDQTPLTGATVVVVADQDDAGQKHALDVAAHLADTAASVRIVAPATGKDAADHVAAGHGVDDFHDTRPVSSWAAVDLGDYLADDYQPEQATLLVRDDGIGLLYPGRVHSLHGQSEGFKSGILQAESVRLITQGKKVAYIDFESDPHSLVGRLLMLGATKDAIRDHFDYRNPEQPATSAAAVLDYQDLLGTDYALLVIDGVTDAMGVLGHAQGDWNADATTFIRWCKKLAADTGAAVVLIDHVAKGNTGRFAIGGVAKMNGLTGAAYTVEVSEPVVKGAVGKVVLRVGKDRPGYVREHCDRDTWRADDRTQIAAVIVVDSTDVPVKVTVGNQDPERGTWLPTILMQRVSEFLRTCPAPVSQNQIVEGLGGKRKSVIVATNALVANGYVARESGPRGALLHRLVRSFEARDTFTYSPEGGNRLPDSNAEDGAGTLPVPVPTKTWEQGTGQSQGSRPVPGTGGEQVGTGGGSATCTVCRQPLGDTPGDVHMLCAGTLAGAK